MRYTFILMVSGLLWFAGSAWGFVDTLRGETEIEDATLYGYEDCDYERSGEDCRRYNAGSTLVLRAGNDDLKGHVAVMRFPTLAGDPPDSAALMLYCTLEKDTLDRRLFAFPLIRDFVEGTESRFEAGAYPTSDSGVTWYHAYLDINDLDSLNWTTPGGDYTTAVACTATVTDSDAWCRFANFERLLQFWDTSGYTPGICIVNEKTFPVNSSLKVMASTENGSEIRPMLLRYYPHIVEYFRRRRLLILGPGDNPL